MNDNKLIAEFMGVKEQVSFYDNFERGAKTYSTSTPGHSSLTYSEPEKSFNDFVETVNYRSDWNLLMPVVEKIESLGYDTAFKTSYCRINPKTWDYDARIVHVNKDGSAFCILEGMDSVPLQHCENITKIGMVYFCVVEFIKWYNKQL